LSAIAALTGGTLAGRPRLSRHLTDERSLGGGLCILYCPDIRDVWQSGITLTLPLVENLTRDEIAGPLRILTRNHVAALMPSRSGRPHAQISARNTDRRSDAGSTNRLWRDRASLKPRCSVRPNRSGRGRQSG